MARERYKLNDGVTLLAEFHLKATSALADPTTVTLKVRDPNGTITTYTRAGGTITKLDTGWYKKQITATVGGLWSYSWHGTGTVPVSAEGSFEVDYSNYGID